MCVYACICAFYILQLLNYQLFRMILNFNIYKSFTHYALNCVKPFYLCTVNNYKK